MNKITALLLIFTLAAQYLQGAEIGPDVRTGTLPNGMTYYIQHNATPAGTADFFLAQKTGSVYEDDDQQGLAHFLEHMCFNGTEHFPGNSVISYLESIGVKFGAHLNAYTSTDETVYNICKAPVSRPSTVDSCMLILRDWCCGLTLDPSEIDAERGVIESEWRQRNSAANRMLERISPLLYGGSSYGKRLPIGKMDVVRNFTPQTLRRLYDRWNVPSNQAVIIVGDIDVDAVENKVSKLFGTIPAKRSSLSQHARRPEVPVSDTLIVATASDAEQGSEMLQLYWRLPYDDSFAATALSEILAGLLVERFEQAESSPDCPHLSLALGKTKYFLAGGEQTFTLRGPVKAGKAAEAVRLWVGELLRACRHGFDNAEIGKAIDNYTKTLAENTRKDAGSTNTALARRCVRHFLDGGRVMTAQAVADSLLSAARATDNKSLVSFLNGMLYPQGRATVILHYRPEGIADDVDKKMLTEAMQQAYDAEYEPFVPTERQAASLQPDAACGTITATDSLPQFDTKVYTLSNGIRVYAKRTDCKAGQVYVRGIGPGGLSLVYAPSKVPTLRVINELMAEQGCGGYTAADIRRMYAGRQVKVSVTAGKNEEVVEAATTSDDFEAALALLHMRLTAFEPDSAAFLNFVEAQRHSVAHRRANPTQAMGDTIHHTIYSRHPLAARMNAEDVEKIDLGTAFEVYADRFGDMSDYIFVIAGDFDPDSLDKLLERYIASLPGGGRNDRARDFGYAYTDHDFELTFERPMENPQGIVYSFYNGPADYSLDEMLLANVFGQVLRRRLLAELREKRGITYSVKSHAAVNAGISAGEGPRMMLPTYIKTAPGSEEDVLETVNNTIAALSRPGGIEQAEEAAVKEFLIKNHREAAGDNAYWLRILKEFATRGEDFHNGYEQAVERLEANAISEFGQRVIMSANKASIIMKAAPEQ